MDLDLLHASLGCLWRCLWFVPATLLSADALLSKFTADVCNHIHTFLRHCTTIHIKYLKRNFSLWCVLKIRKFICYANLTWKCLFYSRPGVKLGRIPPDLRSGASRLRSTTSNNRSCTSQLTSGTFLLGSTTLRSLYLSFFSVCMMFCKKKCSRSRSFCQLHLSMLGVDRCCKVKRYLNATNPNRVPWMLENPWSAVRNPTSALCPSGSSFSPSKPRTCRDPPPIAELFNHCWEYVFTHRLVMSICVMPV